MNFMNLIKKYLESAIHFVEDLIGIHSPHPKEQFLEAGEVTVSGTGTLDIPLHHHPHHFYAHFVGECSDSVPCNPGQIDSITYSVEEHYDMNAVHKKKYVLHLEYCVSGSRIIAWSIH